MQTRTARWTSMVRLVVAFAMGYHRVYASFTVDVHTTEDKRTELRISSIVQCHLFVANSTRELDNQNVVRIVVTSFQECREEGFCDRHLGGVGRAVPGVGASDSAEY